MKPYIDLFKQYVSRLIENDGKNQAEIGVWKITKDLVLAFLSNHFEAGDWFAEDFVYGYEALNHLEIRYEHNCFLFQDVPIPIHAIAETPPMERHLKLQDFGVPQKQAIKMRDACRSLSPTDSAETWLSSLGINANKYTKELKIYFYGKVGTSQSHYTPMDWVESMVHHTIEPHLTKLKHEGKWNREGILNLRILDPACGSGAFLLGVVRYLAAAICELETTEQLTLKGIRNWSQYQEVARYVINHCIYGSDIDSEAICATFFALSTEVGAHSISTQEVNPHLLWGDTLVGVTEEQLSKFHWDLIANQPDRSFSIPRHLHPVYCDCLIALYFNNANDRLREQARQQFIFEQINLPDQERFQKAIKMSNQLRQERQPIHWWLQAPELFSLGTTFAEKSQQKMVNCNASYG